MLIRLLLLLLLLPLLLRTIGLNGAISLVDEVLLPLQTTTRSLVNWLREPRLFFLLLYFAPRQERAQLSLALLCCRALSTGRLGERGRGLDDVVDAPPLACLLKLERLSLFLEVCFRRPPIFAVIGSSALAKPLVRIVVIIVAGIRLPALLFIIALLARAGRRSLNCLADFARVCILDSSVPP